MKTGTRLLAALLRVTLIAFAYPATAVPGDVEAGFSPDVNGDVLSTAAQPDGKIIIAGSFTIVNGIARNGIARLNASGTLDTDFNPDANGEVSSAALQPDGKVLLGGSFTAVSGVPRSRVARLLADGTLDAEFVPDANGPVHSTIVQPDGRVLIAGLFTSVDGVPRNRNARLHPDGALDMDFNPNANGPVRSMAVQVDGKILVGGAFTAAGGLTRNRVARFHASGTLDTGANQIVRSIVVQADGRIVIAGSFTFVGATPRHRIARLRTDGTLEGASADFNPGVDGTMLRSLAVQPDRRILVTGSFGTVGGLTLNGFTRLHSDGAPETGFHPDAGGGSSVFCTAVQADAKIVIAGSFNAVGGVARSYLARLHADGSLDTAFNPSPNGTVYSAATQTDGMIVIAGAFSRVGGVTRTGIVRLHPDGTLETAFNPRPDSSVFSMWLQADGKIVIAGAFTTVNGVARGPLARLHADGSLDMDFHPNLVGHIISSLVQADGKIVITGPFAFVSGLTPIIARLNPDGTRDTAFNPNPNNGVRCMAQQADGKLLISGDFTSLDGVARDHIARFHADGALDMAFNPDLNGAVWCTALQADGKVIVGGEFTMAEGAAHERIARLDNDPAMVSLTAPDSTRVQWLRAGSSPEVEQVSFDRSTDGGSTWAPLGAGRRITGGWELTGLSLAGTGLLRARGVTTSGHGSSGRVETLAPYPLAPEILVEQPAGTNLADGGTKHFGALPTGRQASVTFALRNTGYADLNLRAITTDGTHAADFSVTAGPIPTVPGPNGRTVFTVRFVPTTAGPKTAALHIESNDIDENPFDIILTGHALEGAYWIWAFDEGIINHPLSAPAADLDGDGIDNRQEFACGLSPLQNDTRTVIVNGANFTHGLPIATLTGTPQRLRVTFLRRLNVAGLTYAVEFSDDAIAWQTSTSAPVVISSDGTFEAVTVDDTVSPAGRTRRFVRLRVTMP